MTSSHTHAGVGQGRSGKSTVTLVLSDWDHAFTYSSPLELSVLVGFVSQYRRCLFRTSRSTHRSYPHNPPGRRSNPICAAVARCCFRTPGINGAYSHSSVSVSITETYVSQRRRFPSAKLRSVGCFFSVPWNQKNLEQARVRECRGLCSCSEACGDLPSLQTVPLQRQLQDGVRSWPPLLLLHSFCQDQRGSRWRGAEYEDEGRVCQLSLVLTERRRRRQRANLSHTQCLPHKQGCKTKNKLMESLNLQPYYLVLWTQGWGFRDWGISKHLGD